MVPFGVVSVYAGVVVPVGNVDVAVGRDDRFRRLAERFSVTGARNAWRADHQHLVAVPVELADAVIQPVDQEDIVVVVDKDAVGVLQDAVADGPDEPAVPVKHDQGMFASRVDVHLVLRIAGDSGYPAEGPAFGKLPPVLVDFVRISIAAETHRHASSCWV